MPASKPKSKEIQPGPILSVDEMVARIKVPFAMTVASKRNTGKSVYISQMIRALLQQKKIDMVVVLSNTAHINETDYAWVPSELVQPFSEGAIKKLLRHQEATPKEDRKQILLVLDDVLSDKAAENSNYIKQLFVQGRHFMINVVCISQSANGYILTPTLKNNSDFILYSRLNRYQLATLWESLTNIDKKEFVRFSETHNKDYTFLCIDNTSNSVNPADFILRTRAEADKKLSKGSVDMNDDEVDLEESDSDSE